MKSLKTLKLFILCLAILPGAIKANPNRGIDTVTATIDLSRIAGGYKPDSVLIIFDKYDLTGAGIVKQTRSVTNSVISVRIPSGKYYVVIICLRSHKSFSFTDVYTISQRKRNRIMVNEASTSRVVLSKTMIKRYLRSMDGKYARR